MAILTQAVNKMRHVPFVGRAAAQGLARSYRYSTNMALGTKVLIGGGVVGAISGGIYGYRRNDWGGAALGAGVGAGLGAGSLALGMKYGAPRLANWLSPSGGGANLVDRGNAAIARGVGNLRGRMEARSQMNLFG